MKETKKLYSVKDICNEYEITRKTLFYYDKTGLLKPTERKGKQQFKYYDDQSIERLKTIISYREAGLNIMETKQLLDSDNKEEKLSILEKAMKRLKSEKERKENEIKKLAILTKTVSHS